MEGITIRMEGELRAALHVAAEVRGVSDGEMARRIIRRGLAVQASDTQSQVLADAVRGAVREELRTTQRYAYLAAREAMRSHPYGIGLVGILVTNVLRWPTHRREAVLEQLAVAAQHYAAQHLEEGKEPDDPALDGPAKPLPGPEEEVTIGDQDTASMIEGV